MEPRRKEPKAPTPRPEEKPKRFRIVKLEERIAPTKGGNATHHCTTNCTNYTCATYCTVSIE
jgi:hypothetical protein